MVPAGFRGDVALLGPDPAVELWTCQCHRMCVRGGAQPPQHTVLCFIGKAPCWSGKESALAVRSRDEKLTSSKETWVNWAEGRRTKAVLLQFLGLVPAVLS